MKNYVYIYNLQQAYFYIREGLTPITTDKHKKTGMIFFVFDKKESNSIYTKWLNKKN